MKTPRRGGESNGSAGLGRAHRLGIVVQAWDAPIRVSAAAIGVAPRDGRRYGPSCRLLGNSGGGEPPPEASRLTTPPFVPTFVSS